MQNVFHVCTILTKIGMCKQTLSENSTYKFHETPSGLSRPATCGRTDGLTKLNSLFFHCFAKRLNYYYCYQHHHHRIQRLDAFGLLIIYVHRSSI